MLIVFSLIFVTDTKINCFYDFEAPLRTAFSIEHLWQLVLLLLCGNSNSGTFGKTASLILTSTPHYPCPFSLPYQAHNQPKAGKEGLPCPKIIFLLNLKGLVLSLEILSTMGFCLRFRANYPCLLKFLFVSLPALSDFIIKSIFLFPNIPNNFVTYC